VVTPEESSRIISPEALAEALGLDTSHDDQRAIDALIDEAVRRYGPLAMSKPKRGDEGEDSIVGVINDYTLAEIMRIPIAGRLLVDRASGSFFAFDDKHGIFSQITREETCRKLSGVYARLPELSDKTRLLAGRPASVRCMKNLLDAMAGAVGENYPFGGDPDVRPGVVHRPVANGLLSFDLSVDKPPLFRAGLCPSDRALHRAPVSYDPAAGSVPSRLLNELLIPSLGGSEETANEFLDDMAGAWIGGDLWPFVFALIGAADSGKSQLVEILRALHGKPHWCALSAKNISDKFGVSFLTGPVLVVSFTDAKSDALTGEIGGLIKSLTGSDYVQDRGPHAQLLVSISGNKVFLLTSNGVPRISLEDDSAAWERRLRAYRFNAYPVEKRIADFGRVLLMEEGSIILNRLIDGARRRIALRLAGQRPAVRAPMKEIVSDILRRSCDVATYLESNIIAEDGNILRSESFSQFSDWIRVSNKRPWSKEDFCKRAGEVMIRAYGAPLSNSLPGGKGWRGVRWLNSTEIAAD